MIISRRTAQDHAGGEDRAPTGPEPCRPWIRRARRRGSGHRAPGLLELGLLIGKFRPAAVREVPKMVARKRTFEAYCNVRELFVL